MHFGVAALPNEGPEARAHDYSGGLLQMSAWRMEDFCCSCSSSATAGQPHIPVNPVVLNCGHVHCGLATEAGLHKCTAPWELLTECSRCNAPVSSAPVAFNKVDFAATAEH